jgi:hypothetical protein
MKIEIKDVVLTVIGLLGWTWGRGLLKIHKSRLATETKAEFT